MQIVKNLLSASILFLLIPSISSANYCVQVSSVNSVDKVYILKQVHHRTLQNEPDLRIEKLGNFYTLRVGDFSHKSDAKESLQRIRKSFKGAYIRHCVKHPQHVVYSSSQKYIKKYSSVLKKQEKKCETMLAPNYDTDDIKIK